MVAKQAAKIRREKAAARKHAKLQRECAWTVVLEAAIDLARSHQRPSRDGLTCACDLCSSVAVLDTWCGICKRLGVKP